MLGLVLKKRNRSSGFTLIEVLIVVGIIGIMAAIAVPNFLSWLPNIRLKAATRDLYANMQKAKIEAIKRNCNVVINFTTANCAALPVIPTPNGSYQIFVDDGNGAGGVADDNILNGTEQILVTEVMPTNVALCQETFTGITAGFTPKGLPVGSNFGSVTLNNNQTQARTLNLTIAGGLNIP